MATREHGSWPSPISARDANAGNLLRTRPQMDGTTIYWQEARPDDQGRVTLVRLGGDGLEDVSLPGQNVRTRFHEYGGGAFAAREGVVLFVEFGDQRVWRGAPDEEPRPITPPSEGLVRFACFRIDTARGNAFCLREDQRDPTLEPVTSLVRLDLLGPNADYGTQLVAGRARPRDVARELPSDVGSPPDFVTDPVLSPDGGRIAWISWNHPNMAWDGTWLHVGRLDDAGNLSDVSLIAGSEHEAIEQPRWLDDDRITFLSDRTGWSNHQIAQLGSSDSTGTPVHDDPHEYGQPRWTPDQSSYDVLPDGRFVTTRVVDGSATLCVLDPATGELSRVDSPLTFASDVRAAGPDRVVCRASFADRPAELVTVDLADGTTTPVVDDTGPAPERGLVSLPEPVDWPTTGDARAYGFFYAPANASATAPPGELPPLLVTLHGGPTAAAIPAYTLPRTFWTSRGWAVLDVNYAGSTGFGRAYRQRLDGAWGIADVADVAAGVRHLVTQGRVDGSRVAITGGSAGGFTTLAALTFTDVFTAGASHFGVSDLGALARDTHKLESRYLWRLVAPWPEGEQTYEARSPLRHVDRLSAPLILLQGSDDRVVPPAQAETMADAARAKGLPMALVMFDGEGHGFRSVDNQTRALECELSFYAQVFGLELADDIVPVHVENAPGDGASDR